MGCKNDSPWKDKPGRHEPKPKIQSDEGEVQLISETQRDSLTRQMWLLLILHEDLGLRNIWELFLNFYPNEITGACFLLFGVLANTSPHHAYASPAAGYPDRVNKY